MFWGPGGALRCQNQKIPKDVKTSLRMPKTHELEESVRGPQRVPNIAKRFGMLRTLLVHVFLGFGEV